MPAITGFHPASFTVSDREKRVAWYQGVLRFERHSEVEGDTFSASTTWPLPCATSTT